MTPEKIAEKVLESRIKVRLEDALANTTPSRCMAMYVHSAYNAIVEAINLDRESKSRPYRYAEAKTLLKKIVEGFLTLSGDAVGADRLTWKEQATKTAKNLRNLADLLDSSVSGNVKDKPVTFPSPEDLED